MSDIIYNLEETSDVTIRITQDTCYINKWELLYQGGPFPFFDDSDTLLWSLELRIRDSYLISPNSTNPYITLTNMDDSSAAQSYTFITQEMDTEDIIHTYYGFYLTPEDTTKLPVGRLLYLLKIIRTEDEWKVKVQQGMAVISPCLL